MTTSLIISTYNWPDALELCLRSVARQSVLPSEIIIADDGSKVSTKNTVEEIKKELNLKIKHIWHPDNGFKLAEIRNKAIAESSSEYIIQVDGDVILHRDFIRDHINFAKRKSFIKGRRMMIGERKSLELLKKKSINISFLSDGVKRREHGLRLVGNHIMFQPKEEKSADGVMGSNMAFWKEDFVEINGYNNALQGWGAEDKELAQRFVNLGLVKRKIKFGAVQYHIYHPQSNSSAHDDQIKEIERLRTSEETRCINGLNQIQKDYLVYE